MDVTKAEDAPGGSAENPMDEERRRFLEEALKSLTVDVPRVLQRGIRILSDAELVKSVQLGDPVPDDIRSAFSNMMEFVDKIDVANDFQKMGGFAIFPICLTSENEGIRLRACQLLAEVCQNNGHCQDRAIEYGLIPVLLQLINSETGEALARCISALSSIVRGQNDACRDLISRGGCEILVGVLPKVPVPVRARTAFLMCYLAQVYEPARIVFARMNVIKTAAEMVKAGRDSSSEQLLCLLASLTQGMDSKVVLQYKDPELNLRKILEDHLKIPGVQDRFIEERDCCEVLLKVLDSYPHVDPENCDVDR